MPILKDITDSIKNFVKDAGTQILGSMPPILGGELKFVSTDQVRDIGDWARTYTWNVNFDWDGPYSSPYLFTWWLPATDLGMDIAGVETQEFTGGVLGFTIPKSSPAYKLTMTILDEHKLVMTNFIYQWMHKIVDRKKGCVLPVKDACATCNVLLFDSEGSNRYWGKFYVFPSGTFQTTRNSSSEVVSHQFEFEIAGIKQEIMYGTELLNNDTMRDASLPTSGGVS